MARLAYEAHGHGPTVVLLHGGGCDRSFWELQTAHLRDRFRVVVPDLRGHGASPAPAGDYTMEVLADDVAELCAALGLDDVAVVGHSLGGVIAYVMAARHPDLVTAVGALDSPVVMAPEMAAMFAPLLEATASPDFAAMARAQTEAGLGGDFDPDLRRRILDGQAAVRPEVLASVTKHVYANTFSDALASLKMPALYVFSVMPTDLDRLRQLCPQVKVETITGVGHFIPFEAADEVNAILDRFLDESLATDA